MFPRYCRCFQVNAWVSKCMFPSFVSKITTTEVKAIKDAEYDTERRLWQKISTKKELKYQPWFNNEFRDPVNPKLYNTTVLQ